MQRVWVATVALVLGLVLGLAVTRVDACDATMCNGRGPCYIDPYSGETLCACQCGWSDPRSCLQWAHDSPPTTCHRSGTCQNGGVCASMDGCDIVCNCTGPWTGQFCGTPLPISSSSTGANSGSGGIGNTTSTGGANNSAGPGDGGGDGEGEVPPPTSSGLSGGAVIATAVGGSAFLTLAVGAVCWTSRRRSASKDAGVDAKATDTKAAPPDVAMTSVNTQ